MFLRNLPLALAMMTVAAAPQLANAQQQPQAKKPVYYQHWMHKDVNRAWSKGFTGKGANVTVIDSFDAGAPRFKGNLKNKVESKTHGGWTSEQVRLLAPGARVIEQNFAPGRLSKLPTGFNVLNLSFGAYEKTDAKNSYKVLNDQGKSIVDHARKGSAVVVKAAGNASTPQKKRPVGQINDTYNDAMSLALKGSKSVLFVGALDKHGSRKSGQKAQMAWYSNVAGKDKQFNSRFVVVGVPGSTSLNGTSFAAPVVSGYAAILHSKFQKATPTEISNQILKTARRDTIRDYNLAVHGQGEASLARALAPRRIR